MARTSDESARLFEQAQRVIPGGVNSPVRAFRSVGRDPLYIKRGKGSRIYDVEGREYIDYVCSWGPLIFGHADDDLLETLRQAAAGGTSFGANTELEVRFAELVCEAFPSIDLVRMVNSGTEAAMSAVRLARGHTGRDKVVKFAGCYHGHGDSFLIKAGSGVLTLGIPGSPGVTAATAGDTLLAEFNRIESVEKLLEAHRGEVAAVILEPVVGNAGVIPPREGFLRDLRRLTEGEGVLLVFDEVITGFRVAWGGAQERYGVRADLTCLGKIIGGGLPVGAFGGRREIMESLAPLGPVYQAGTLSGNPLAMALGLRTVQRLRDEGVYETLEQRAALLEEGLRENLKRIGRRFAMNRVGSMMSLFFTESEVTDPEAAETSDTELFAAYFGEMLAEGVYLAPSQFEAAFVSAAHSERDIRRTVEASAAALKRALER